MMRSSGGALAAVVIGLLALFVLLCSTSAHEEEDTHILLPTQGEEGDEGKGKKPWECCDLCVCTKSIPPLCQCRDRRLGSCHPRCEKCKCTRSEPPLCTCEDVIHDFCGDRCTSAAGSNKTK